MFLISIRSRKPHNDFQVIGCTFRVSHEFDNDIGIEIDDVGIEIMPFELLPHGSS